MVTRICPRVKQISLVVAAGGKAGFLHAVRLRCRQLEDMIFMRKNWMPGRRHGLHRLPEFAENRVAEMQNRAKEFSEYEGNRNRAPDRRPRPRGHPQGDPPHHAYPRGRPVTDNIGTVGTILLCYGRFDQTARVEVVHSDENADPDRGDTGGVELKA